MTTADFTSYNADEVKASLAGIPIDSGFADGEFIRIERETEAFTDVVGTDGKVTRSKSNDERATVTFFVMQTAEVNVLLSALHNADKLAPGGTGVGALLIQDLNGTTLHKSAQSWIQTDPVVSYDREATAREWQIRCAKLKNFLTGT